MCQECLHEPGSDKLEMCAGDFAKTPLRRGKRDIVDTIFHASCATRQISALESALPTVWEGQIRSKGLEGRRHTIVEFGIEIFDCLGMISVPAAIICPAGLYYAPQPSGGV